MPYGVLPYINGVSSVPGQEDLVNSLISQLETPPAPQAPAAPGKVPVWARILGPIGDALITGSVIQRGGTPAAYGPYQTSVMRRGQDYRDALAAYQQQLGKQQESSADLRNQVRIGQFEREQTQQGAEDLARIRLTQPTRAQRLQRSEFVRDVNGTPRRFRQFSDPFTGAIVPVTDPETGDLVNEIDLGPAGYAPTILPGMEVTDQGPQAGIFRIPKGGGATTRVPGPGGVRLEPQMPPGMIQSVGGEQGVVSRVPEVMDVFNRAAESVGGSEGALRQTMNWVKAKAAGTSIGPIVTPPELVNYYSSVRSVLFPYVKSISGAQFPEAELRRYEAQFPIPGVDPPDVANHKWDVIIDQMVTDIRAKYGAAGRTPPGATGAPQGNDVDSILREYDATHPRP